MKQRKILKKWLDRQGSFYLHKSGDIYYLPNSYDTVAHRWFTYDEVQDKWATPTRPIHIHPGDMIPIATLMRAFPKALADDS